MFAMPIGTMNLKNLIMSWNAWFQWGYSYIQKKKTHAILGLRDNMLRTYNFNSKDMQS